MNQFYLKGKWMKCKVVNKSLGKVQKYYRLTKKMNIEKNIS